MGDLMLIYGLVDPRTGGVRYIGKSSTGMKRPNQHLAQAVRLTSDQSHRARWLRKLSRLGLRCTVIVLEACSTDAAHRDAEQRWILAGKRLGWALTNGTEGGTGGKASEATRARMSAAHRARHQLAPVSDATRAKISAANKGKIRSDETKANLRAMNLGKKASEETRAKLSAIRSANPVRSMLGKKRDDATRAKISAGHMGKKFSAETREKIRQAKLGKPRPDLLGKKRFGGPPCDPPKS